MDTRAIQRRGFLKVVSVAISAFALPFVPSFAKSQSAAVATTDKAVGVLQFIAVSIRGDLYNPPNRIQVSPNSWSDIVTLPNKGDFRIRVIPVRIDSRFGQVFLVQLGDQNGKVLAQDNLGDGATQTYSSYGVQIHIRSVRVAS